MTLTVCIGSSGSGKTTFLNDVSKQHKCTYIRQYHNLRPYITVTKIPYFDPSSLPFWETYVKEETDQTIQVGGTMAGRFYPGFSGGQRKLMLFELIYQRTMNQSGLLIVFDEPFAGVTDDFVPFIVDRLNRLRQKHNVLLVTNDHVQTLTEMADNTIKVSAIDRNTVLINNTTKVGRDKAITALSLGDDFAYEVSSADLKFFLDVEVTSNKALIGVAVFTVFLFSLFVLTFWNSSPESLSLVAIASTNVVFFCVQPYTSTLTDWRNAMLEEAEARTHASKGMNKALKTLLAIALIFLVSVVEFCSVNLVIDGLASFEYWLAMFCDMASLLFPGIIAAVYTRLPLQSAQFMGVLPMIMVVFFSTTFSPGSGVGVVKELRYLFPRFYFWCMLPGVQDEMEGCPVDEQSNVLYLVLSSLVGVFVFGIARTIAMIRRVAAKKSSDASKKELKQDKDMQRLQRELFGDSSKLLSVPPSDTELPEDSV